MDRKAEYEKLLEKWAVIMNRMQDHESYVRDFGTGDLLHPSEIHTIKAVGDHEGVNISRLAGYLGITRSGASQMVNKLEKKGLLQKMKREGNEKEIILGVTGRGMIAYTGHEAHHRRIEEIIYAELDRYDDRSISFLLEFLSGIDRIFGEVSYDDPLKAKGDD